MNSARPHRPRWHRFKKVFRTVKVLFPALTDAKYTAQRIGRGLARKPHETDFRALALLHDSKPEGDVLFLDIGANRGQTIDSVRLYKQYSIVSVEANTLLAHKLQRQRANDPRLKILNYALSDRTGETTLYIPKYRGYLFDGLGSMVRSEAESWLNASLIYGFRQDRLTLVEVRAPMTSVDHLDLAPAFIKIDVQGAEILVLRGARRTIERCRPMLLVELPTQETEGKFLAEMGYAPYAFENDRFHTGIREHHGNSFFFLPEHRRCFPAVAFAEA